MRSQRFASVLVASACCAAFAQERGSINRDDFAPAMRWQKSSDLIGKKIVNSSAEHLGKLEEIVVDASSGRILYGVLSFGGVLGVGDKLFAIPWPALNLASDCKEFVLNVDKDRLKNASGFDKSQWPNFADEQFATTTAEYYGQRPYWRADAKLGDRPTYRQRWYARATNWQKCSDLCNKDIRNPNNEDLGTITECIVDPDCGRLMYGVLAYSGKLVAVPWHALELRADAKHFVLNTTKEQLKNAPGFTKDTYPNLLDSHWAADAHAFFKVQPYWVETDAERHNTVP